MLLRFGFPNKLRFTVVLCNSPLTSVCVLGVGVPVCVKVCGAFVFTCVGVTVIGVGFGVAEDLVSQGCCGVLCFSHSLLAGVCAWCWCPCVWFLVLNVLLLWVWFPTDVAGNCCF